MHKLKLLVATFFVVSPFAANAELIEIEIVPSVDAWFTMTGSFDFDAEAQTYSDMTLNITGDIGPFSFNDTSCDLCPLSGSSVGLVDPALVLTYFLSDFSVTWGGGVLTAIFRGNSFALDEASGRLDGTYSLQAAAPVPEPGTLVLLGIGLFGMALVARRRIAA